MTLSIGLKTDPGPREGANQDTVLAFLSPDGAQKAVLIVSDGMGGAAAGDRASRETVNVLRDLIVMQGLPEPEEVPERLRLAIEAANKKVYDLSCEYPELQGMGCTAVVAVVLDDRYWVASVGDSRAYLLKNGGICQLTEDHTWLNARIKEGVITTEQAAHEYYYLSHVLDRAIGVSPVVEVDVYPSDKLDKDDMLLLCSDGLYGVLDDNKMREISVSRPVQPAAETLIEHGLAAPAEDNLTVALLRLE